jgi:outer membrane receptor protein involved in Fe transport
MAYARLASGYRPGAPNTGAGVALGVVPSSYSPDKTHNYELGIKGDFLDHVVSVDASVYYIDWKNIQLTLLSAQSGQSYTGNAGAAKSEGVELSTQVRPTDHLTVSGWVSYDDAVLTEGFPKSSTVSGLPGAVLPMTARWSGSLSIDDRLPITDSLEGFVGGAYSYINNRLGPFLAATGQRAHFASYSLLNFNTGLRYDTWTGTLFVNNVTDNRGVLNGGAGYFPPFGYSYILPRTVGVNVAKSF